MVALSIAIFVIDTLTKLEIAIAVFYVAVVLLAIGAFHARGVMAVAGGCMALTIVSYFLTGSGSPESGAINCGISLVAIGVTARLGLQAVTATTAMHEARAQLAHAARVTSLGELTASIAHEVNQPLTAIMTSGDASMRWLSAQPPNVPKAKAALGRIVDDASRASEVITRIRMLARRTPTHKGWNDLEGAILEIVRLTRGEFEKQAIALHLELAENIPAVMMDRVQIQQVVLNLILNAIEAMKGVAERPRELTIRSRRDGAENITVAFEDAGAGIAVDQLDALFDAFQTTKPEGLGIGLTISRSIIKAHGGRIWAENRDVGGAVVQFVLPIKGAEPI